VYNRNTSMLTNHVWISYSLLNVTSPYFTCSYRGQRFYCRAHLVAIKWFLSYDEHNQHTVSRRSDSFDQHFTNVVHYLPDTSSSDEDSSYINSEDDNSESIFYTLYRRHQVNALQLNTYIRYLWTIPIHNMRCA
jgi:hypothetical protein